MTKEEFSHQVGRLRTQWPNSYGEERKAILWTKLKDLPDEFIVDAVTEFLANRRSAPVLEDFRSYQDEFAKRSSERVTRRIDDASIRSVMQDTADRAPNKEFAKECMKLLEKKWRNEITHQEFLKGCDLLDQAATVFERMGR